MAVVIIGELAAGLLVCSLGAFGLRLRRRRRDRIVIIMLCTLLIALRVNYHLFYGQYQHNHGKPRVFILAGQSNMAGRGGLVRRNEEVKKVFDPTMLEHAFERELTTADGKVERLTADMKWVPGKLLYRTRKCTPMTNIHPRAAVEPMHKDIDVSKSCGIGPGLLFARMIGGPCRLIPCAVGGTKIDEWSANSPLYLKMIQRAKFANEQIDAMLWFQGESDAIDLRDAETYLGKLRDFVQRTRRDLHQPNLPIIMVAIWCSLDRCPLREEIRRAIFQLPALEHGVRVIDAKDSPLLDDNIHLTSLAQRALAWKFAQETNTL